MEELSKNKVDTSTEVRRSIDHALEIRTAEPGTPTAKVEDLVKGHGARLWRLLKRRPSLGVLLVGGAGLAAAMAVGVGELTIGLAAAYGAYQVLREGVPPRTAAQNVAKELRKLT